MALPLAIRATVDVSGLNNGLKLAMAWSQRTPAEAVNRAALVVAIGAKNRLPFVPIQKIDTELNVITTPVIRIGKRLKPLKKQGKRFSGGLGTSTAHPEVPLAVLIVQARSNPDARYNQLTNQRYALAGSPFKGVDRQTGRMLMKAAVSKMIARRHSSIAFLKAGWIPAVRKLLSVTTNKFRRSSNGPAMDGTRFYGGDLGAAKPATSNLYAVAVIENDIGYRGLNAASFNKALQLYGGPALQAALDDEGMKQLLYYIEKSGDVEMARKVNALAGKA
jgi:hypothetical protein